MELATVFDGGGQIALGRQCSTVAATLLGAHRKNPQVRSVQDTVGAAHGVLSERLVVPKLLQLVVEHLLPFLVLVLGLEVFIGTVPANTRPSGY